MPLVRRGGIREREDLSISGGPPRTRGEHRAVRADEYVVGLHVIALERLGDGHVAPAGLERVDRGRVAEQVEDGVGLAARQRVAGDGSPPRERTKSWLRSEALAITPRAPRRRPLDREMADPARAARDRERLPACRPTASSACSAVSPASGSAPASSKESPAGLCVQGAPAGRVLGVGPDVELVPAVVASTSSAGCEPGHRRPDRPSTTPAASSRGRAVSGRGRRRPGRPRDLVVDGFSPAARTRRARRRGATGGVGRSVARRSGRGRPTRR
jgi:hypothetical protein